MTSEQQRLVNMMIACSITAGVATAIAMVPILWHPYETTEFVWPRVALEAPHQSTAFTVASSGTIEVAEIVPSLPPPSEVKTVDVLKASSEPKRYDICSPGHRVDYGRHWRCVYPGGRHRRR